LVPIGWAFAIWGVIYLMIFGFVVYQGLPGNGLLQGTMSLYMEKLDTGLRSICFPMVLGFFFLAEITNGVLLLA
jgi:hypothetical protein